MVPSRFYLLPSLLLHLIYTTSAATLPSPTLQTHDLTLPTTLTPPPLPPPPTCFSPSPSFPPSLPPILPTDVMTLLTRLLATFSASPVPWNTPDHPVPKIWTHGTVMLSFSRLKSDSWDVFSELQVAKAMAQVVVGCVTASEGWVGGKMVVGPRGLFMISVLGRGAGANDA